MVAVRTLTRAALVVLLGAGTGVWYACSDRAADAATGPAASPTSGAQQATPDLRAAIAVQRRHNDALLNIAGVVGTAVTVLPDGRIGLQVLLEHGGVRGLPLDLEGIPVKAQVTGRLMALSDPTKRQRPAPLGFSVGHPDITAGTIGARVRDALGRVFVLSNNHVLANSNDATVGDAAYQPGPFDGGTAADQIATLADFQPISFSGTSSNTMDAAVALTTTAVLDNATPLDDAYGMPNSAIYGDANADGQFDDRNALLGLAVQKYGRTTRRTHGTITGVNATVVICYEVTGIFCTKSARFVDQLIISPAGFSGGGDSGSLIVTDDANVSPVALLFAGSATQTIANRIDLVLNRFGVTIDGFDPIPPGPFTDVAVTNIGLPAAVVVDMATSVTITVKNLGNQDVSSPFDVTLQDETEVVTVGTQTVAALAVGQSATLTFTWTPHANGVHTLTGRHGLSDGRAGNNQGLATAAVNPPLRDIAITGVTAPPAVSEGHSINVAVTVANVGNLDVGESTVVTLRDETGGVTIGTQTVAGLAVGATTTLTFVWNTTNATLGSHTLAASHDLSDDDAGNNVRNATVMVNPKLTDVALTVIAGPSTVVQGDTAHISVTLQNTGEVNVTTNFTVVLTDATAGGATIVTRTVPGLAVGAVTTLDLPWPTAGSAVGGHTLIAQHTLAADGNGTNNSRAIGISVTAPVSLVADVSVTALTTPGAVTQGNTATIGVTVQNVGQQNVTSSFNVVLMDSTTGITIGTQTVSALAIGASATLSFSWNTASVPLGSHILVATHSFVDGNTTNNRRTATLTVSPQLTDVALTGLTGPSSVYQGDTAVYAVTVQNVGQQNVNTAFAVALKDAGVTVGSQTVNSLAVGASATVSIAWNTAGATIAGHTLIATQMLPDADATNNSRAIGILVKAPVIQVTDVAVTVLNAPAAATQGQTINVPVTVGNVGNQAVESFIVTLQDATAGVTIGTQTVTGLPVSVSATLSFAWNTTGAALGSHTLVATHSMTDANAANNQRSATVTLNAPVLVMDVAVASLTGPASVGQGNPATFGVTVQNVGQLDVTASFDVILKDGAVTIATQTVAGLAVGASVPLSFTWNTTGAALGNHTMVASHSLVDANAANNQRSVVVAVNPRVVDVALTSLTGPAAVTQGDTVHFGVTVQNVGGEDVTASFDVVLTDGAVTIGTQTIAGLATGAVTTLDFAWNTAGVATAGHTIMGRHTLVDNNATNNSRAVGITVNAPSVHVGNLTGSALSNGTTWQASVAVVVHDAKHNLVSGATVRGSWGGPTVGECTTDGTGICTIVYPLIPNTTSLVSFAVTSVTCTGLVYKSGSNHDPDASSNGTTIFLRRP